MKKDILLQIDDAGYGNFVGGIIIGAYSTDIDRYSGAYIDVETVNSDTDIQKEVLNIVKKLIRMFSKDNNIQTIYMCRSNLFDKAAEYIYEKRKKIKLWRGVIEGKLQDMIEEHFINTLISLGVPSYIKFFLKVIKKNKNTGYRLLNNFCINYIKIDIQERLSMCKSQTKLYKKLNGKRVYTDIVTNRARKKKHLCFNCGYYINDKEIKRYYGEDKRNYFYTHIDCINDKN